ncbi:protein HOTHEAD-like [Durio zibethinus]|uniref:Protein HOTHEAD-like n=1 Tax=Durio zibethinus TaxID=66656 RepID=A0A6P5ZQH3_DURZI|nr:protein HOTHEAD-like [Durio zibethinus]
MDHLGSWRFLKVFLPAVFALHHFCHAETAPYYSFVQEATSAPLVSYYDYIIVGGGTAGCPLAATLSESANVLILERGGSPYLDPINKTDKENFFLPLLDPSPHSYAQAFVSEDGVYNHQARVLGGASVFNAGFYSHAETDFIKEAGLDGSLVNDSYLWVEKKVAFKSPVLQWQSAVRDGLLEAGVLPFNGFTYGHINGTKIGASIFDMDGHRHSAADLLEYADPMKIKIYLHATVPKIMLITEIGSRPRAEGVIFEDALGVRHTAFLTKDSESEIILSAGTIGSTQLLMLSGIGPAHQLEALGIQVVMNQPMVGQGMADNPLNGLFIPSPLPVEVSLVSLVGITQFGSYIEAGSGLNLAPSLVQWISKSLVTILNQTEAKVNSSSLLGARLKVGIIIEKVNGPISTGHLELQSTNPNDMPKVMFNYFQAPEDLRKCVQGMETLINVVNSKAFSKFRYPTISTQDLLNLVATLPLNLRPRHLNTATSLEQYCLDTVMTIWHYHGGCHVGKVVDQDFRVLGVDDLRVIDSSTFNFSPGTNPQATVMMLGRYMGIKIQQDRHS